MTTEIIVISILMIAAVVFLLGSKVRRIIIWDSFFKSPFQTTEYRVHRNDDGTKDVKITREDGTSETITA